MFKPLLILALVLAVPAAEKKPTPEEIQLKSTIKSLEEMAHEHQERLRIHKLEIDALRSRVSALESKLSETVAKAH